MISNVQSNFYDNSKFILYFNIQDHISVITFSLKVSAVLIVFFTCNIHNYFAMLFKNPHWKVD